MRKELTSSLLWLALSVFVCVEGIRYQIGEPQQPGPGFFPFWGGLLLGILSLINLVTSFKKEEIISFAGLRWPTLLIVTAAMLVYFVFLETLGFVLLTFLLLFLLFHLERKGWILATAWSAVVTLAAYVLFQILLQTQLPTGLLGF